MFARTEHRDVVRLSTNAKPCLTQDENSVTLAPEVQNMASAIANALLRHSKANRRKLYKDTAIQFAEGKARSSWQSA